MRGSLICSNTRRSISISPPSILNSASFPVSRDRSRKNLGNISRRDEQGSIRVFFISSSRASTIAPKERWSFSIAFTSFVNPVSNAGTNESKLFSFPAAALNIFAFSFFHRTKSFFKSFNSAVRCAVASLIESISSASSRSSSSLAEIPLLSRQAPAQALRGPRGA